MGLSPMLNIKKEGTVTGAFFVVHHGIPNPNRYYLC